MKLQLKQLKIGSYLGRGEAVWKWRLEGRLEEAGVSHGNTGDDPGAGHAWHAETRAWEQTNYS